MARKDRVPAALVAGFWRRIAAILIDSISLGVLGAILGAVFFDFFAQMGGEGRLIGAAILLAYFGLFESALVGGQTLGKRFLRIRVVDREGRCLSVGRSLLRTIIWVIPYSLNNLPVTGPAWLLTVLGLFILTFFFSAVYLLVFNRRTRQTVYDLLTDSYVVREEPQGEVDLQPFWKQHYAIISGWCGIWIVIVCALTFSGIFHGFLSDLLNLQAKVAALPDVMYVSVNRGVNFNSGESHGTSTVVVTSTYAHKIADEEKAIRDIAEALLTDRDDLGNTDYLVIRVGRAYDIGIASGRFYTGESHSLQEWSDLLAKNK